MRVVGNTPFRSTRALDGKVVAGMMVVMGKDAVKARARSMQIMAKAADASLPKVPVHR